jgi:hypothetical protein
MPHLTFDELYQRKYREAEEAKLNMSVWRCVNDPTNYYSLMLFLEPFLFFVDEPSLNVLWNQLRANKEKLAPTYVFNVIKAARHNQNLRKVLELIVLRY